MKKIACVFIPDLNDCLARGKERFKEKFNESLIKKYHGMISSLFPDKNNLI